MARAEKHFTPGKDAVTKVVIVEPAVSGSTEYTLHLSDFEAQSVLAVVGNVIGGGPRRRSLDNVWHALRAAGVPNSMDNDTYLGSAQNVRFKGE